jgi:hypothetical protein
MYCQVSLGVREILEIEIRGAKKRAAVENEG